MAFADGPFVRGLSENARAFYRDSDDALFVAPFAKRDPRSDVPIQPLILRAHAASNPVALYCRQTSPPSGHLPARYAHPRTMREPVPATREGEVQLPLLWGTADCGGTRAGSRGGIGAEGVGGGVRLSALATAPPSRAVPAVGSMSAMSPVLISEGVACFCCESPRGWLGSRDPATGPIFVMGARLRGSVVSRCRII